MIIKNLTSHYYNKSILLMYIAMSVVLEGAKMQSVLDIRP